MARKKELTVEEKLQQEREREIQSIEKEIGNLNEPTYFFNIGDKVQYGSLKESIVEEILYGGKVYVLRCTATNHNYGNAYDYETYRVVGWTEVRPINNGNTSLAKNQDVKINFMNCTIDSLFSKYYHFGVDMQPDYQRGYVWEQSDKELLIDSIFNNIDIGKFVFIQLDDKKWRETGKEYEILDGKQRLSTIIEFYENRFPYKGEYYNDLSIKDKRIFGDHHISVGEIQEADKKIILKYFLMLNRTGKSMEQSQLDKVEQMLNECE